MNKKLLIACVIFLMAPLAMLAADAVTGKWVVSEDRPPHVSTLDLKADGAKLTGTITESPYAPPGVTVPPPTATPLVNGKVDGDTVSFDVNRWGGEITYKYECTVSGAEMKMKITFTLGSSILHGRGLDPMVMELIAKKLKG
jgi:hypothetical protein